MKRVLSFSLCLLFVFFSVSALDTKAVSTSAEAYVLMDADTGIVLSENNKDKRMKMASTTKILTTLLALEKAEHNNMVVTFTKDMTAEGSSMYLKAGDKLRLTDLAAGMMMASGNDAANAVALSLSDSFEAFASLMNKRAAQIGMSNSNFVTPSGLDHHNHYSTAYDMALLMCEAMKNQAFLSISSVREKTVEFVYPEDKVNTYQNHNRLLKLYEHCTGGKTGYTEASGRCLVSSSEKNGIRLVAVTLNAPDDWNDHIALYEYGFSVYKAVTMGKGDAVFTVDISGGEKSKVTASVDEAVTLKVPADMVEDIEKTVYLPGFVFAPVEKGQTLGEITYTLNGKLLTKAEIKADFTVSEKFKPNFFQRLFSLIFNRE